MAITVKALAKLVSEKTGMPVEIDGDANMPIAPGCYLDLNWADYLKITGEAGKPTCHQPYVHYPKRSRSQA